MIPFELLPFLTLMLLGGAVALDGTSFGQFMFSRPFVAASLAGWVVGDPVHGALIGLILEAFHLTVLPVGAAKYPEGGPAAVVGGAIYATSNLNPSTLVLTVLFVLVLEWLGGESIRSLRLANVRIVHQPAGGTITAAMLERRHLRAIGLDFLRGMLLVGGGLVVLAGSLRLLSPLWGLGERVPQVLLSAVVAGLLASSFRVVGSRTWMTMAGMAAGLMFLLLT